MLNLELIEKLIEASDAQPVSVNAADCLNAKHREQQCALCRACPTQAITLEQSAVAVDAARCVECGLCVAICPSRAFASRESDEAILDAVALFTAIEFACPRQPDLDTTRVPQVEGIYVVPCLARLSSDLLTTLAAEHSQVWLNDAPCATCPIGAQMHPHILAARAATNDWLAAWHRSDAVQCYTDSVHLMAVPRRAPRARHPRATLSRREFFSFFTRNLASTAAGQAKPAVSGARARSALFERALARLGAPDTEQIASPRLATITVTEACTACGWCAKMCPTAALEFCIEEDTFALAFRPQRCLGTACQLCARICLPQVIHLTPGATRQALLTDAPQILRCGALSRCTQCHTPFAFEQTQSLCPVCRAIEDKRAALARDLFKRF